MTSKLAVVPLERIESRIFFVRGQKILLDEDLAALYEVEVKALNRAVKRNIERFPDDFMFQLNADELALLRRQSGTSNLKSQNGTSSRGGRRYLPYAFTEQGVAMLSSVLRSPRAVMVNIEIMRAFVRLRQMLASNAALARKLATLEKKYDAQFKIVFDAIRELMTPPDPKKKRPIGFAPWEGK
ncbi:MAG: ORF6N domain-containing protein [Gallionella sp.]|nr:ORF6N domain-containing protein [Gallionella sp.]